MFRHIIAASAVAFMTTGALAQQAGENLEETINANREPGQEIDRARADDDARFTDFDLRLQRLEQMMSDADAGAGAGAEDTEGFDQAGGTVESTVEANNDQDSDLVGTNQ